MTGRKIFLVRLAIGLVVVGFALMIPLILQILRDDIWERGPVFEGCNLSDWIITYDRGWQYDASLAKKLRPNKITETKNAENAIVKIGTNSLPYLIRWIQHDEPTWPQSVISHALQQHFYNNEYYFTERAHAAERAIVTLGAHYDIPVEPLHVILITPFNSRPWGRGSDPGCRAGYALASLGEKSIPAFASALTNSSPEVRYTAIFCAERLGTNANALVPILLRTINDKFVGFAALELLNQLKVDPKLIVAELIATMHNNRNDLGAWAMEQLMYYGTNARGAVPEVLVVMNGDYGGYSYRAEKWMKKIAPDLLTNAPSH